MPMFKYETIQVVSDNDPRSSADRSKLKERERSATYAKGFKDGVNVTKNSIEIEKTKLMALLNEKLSDLDITNELATVTVMKSLHPLFEAVISKLGHSVIRGKFLEAVEQAVLNAVGERSHNNIVAEVPANLRDDFETLCREHNLPITLNVNEQLGDMEIRLNWVGGYDQLDWSSADQIISRVFDDYMESINEDNHERRRHTGR